MKHLILTLGLAALLIGCEKPLNIEEIAQAETYWFGGIENDDFDTYLDTFVKVAAEHDINLDYVFDGSIIFDTVVNNSWTGSAYGRGDDNAIRISINVAFFDKLSPLSKWALVFHELGHDVLNYRHSDGISNEGIHLMNQARNRNINNPDELKTALDQMFIHYNNNN